MVKFIYPVIVALGAASISFSAAHATLWNVEKEKSTLQFTAVQNNADVTGQFNSFGGEIDFDPNHLESIHIMVEVDIASLASNYEEMTSSLQAAEWLAVASFPKATFTSTKVTHIADKKYQADGRLTIRDITSPVTLQFELNEYSDTKAKVTGNTVLSRTKFGVGQGQWQDTAYVKDEVKVNFTLYANAVK